MGNGSVGLPYIISAASTGLTVTDSSTFHFSLIGSNLTGNVKLDGGAGNLIVSAAGGLRLNCADIASCLAGSVHIQGADSTTVHTTVTGSGTSGSPFVVTGTAQISGTAGNLITSDSGGLLLTCAAVQACIGTMVQANSGTGGSTPGSTAVPAGNTTIDNPGIAITNPSGSASATILLTYTASVTVSMAATQGYVVGMNTTDLLERVNGGTITVPEFITVTYTQVGTLAPGASATFSQPLYVRQAGVAGATYSATQWQVSYLLMTS